MPSTLISKALSKSQNKATADPTARKAWIPFLRKGVFTSMSGRVATITDQQLQEVAESYSPSILRAPLIVGHDTKGIDDRELYQSPLSYGIISGVRFRGQEDKDGDVILEALVDPCSEVAANWIEEGHVSNCSPSFYLPDSPFNPTPGQLYLRHIALLGRDAPAIPGLPEIHFSSQLKDIESGIMSGAIAFSIDPNFTSATGEAAFFDDGDSETEASAITKLVSFAATKPSSQAAEFLRGVRSFMIAERGLVAADRIIPKEKIHALTQTSHGEWGEWKVGDKPHTLSQLYESLTSPPFDWIGRCLRRPLLIVGGQGSGKSGFAEFIAGCRVLFFGDTVSVVDPHAQKMKWELLFPEVTADNNNFKEYEEAIARAMVRYEGVNEPRHTTIWDEVTAAMQQCDREKFKKFLFVSLTESRKAGEDPIFIAHESNFDDLADSGSFQELMSRGLVKIERFAAADGHGVLYPDSSCCVSGLEPNIDSGGIEICFIADWMRGSFLLELFGSDVTKNSVPRWSRHWEAWQEQKEAEHGDSIAQFRQAFQEELAALSLAKPKVESNSDNPKKDSLGSKSKSKKPKPSKAQEEDEDEEDDGEGKDNSDDKNEDYMVREQGTEATLAFQRKVEELERRERELQASLEAQSERYQKLEAQRKRERAVSFAQQNIKKGVLPKDVLNESVFEFATSEGVPTKDRMTLIDFMAELDDRQLSYFESFVSNLEPRDSALFGEITSGASPLSGRSPHSSYSFSQQTNEAGSDRYSEESNTLHFAAMRLIQNNTGLSYEDAILQLSSRLS